MPSAELPSFLHVSFQSAFSLCHRVLVWLFPKLLRFTINTSHFKTTANLQARAPDAKGRGHDSDDPMALWVSRIRHPFTFSSLSRHILGRVSFVKIESCAFSTPHISLIHPLITHSLPCCPLRDNK